jgi:hypothetical protein
MGIESDEDLSGLEGMNEDGESIPEEVLKEAKSLGWVPLEKFRGNKEQWVDADEFVERGKNVMPILRATNDRLRNELLTRDRKIDTLQRTLEGATTAIQRLEAHYTAANKRAVEIAKAQLKEDLKGAIEDRDVDRELEIRDKIEELRVAGDKVEPVAKPSDKKDPPSSDLSPEFKEWQDENPWYGEDKKRTKAILRIAEDLRDEGNKLVGKEFMDECLQKLEEQEADTTTTIPPQRRPSKVDTGNPAAGGPSSGKGWNSLPKEAQQACLQDAEELVGPEKRYKSLDDWKKAYTKLYFAE